MTACACTERYAGAICLDCDGAVDDLKLRAEVDRLRAAIRVLADRGEVTFDPREATHCCGIPRDEDGYCVHRPGHPIYVAMPDLTEGPGSTNDVG